jgi:hypothetical protein
MIPIASKAKSGCARLFVWRELLLEPAKSDWLAVERGAPDADLGLYQLRFCQSGRPHKGIPIGLSPKEQPSFHPRSYIACKRPSYSFPVSHDGAFALLEEAHARPGEISRSPLGFLQKGEQLDWHPIELRRGFQ